MNCYLLGMLALLVINFQAHGIKDTSASVSTKTPEIIMVPQQNSVQFMRSVIKMSTAQHRTISLRGTQHSQGGHTLNDDDDGVVLDLSALNHMSMVAPDVIRIQAGARWKQVIEYLNPLGWSLAVVQSDCDFSVGGTIAVNAHGWQFNKPPIIATVEGLHLLLADGTLRYCSRHQHAELFKAVIGGYGLLGIIIDVDLKVTRNGAYQLKQWVIESTDFLPLYQQIKQNQQAELFFGRFSLHRDHFLRRIIVRLYENQDQPLTGGTMTDHQWYQGITNWFFAQTYGSNFFKKLRWLLESSSWLSKLYQYLSRNQLLYHTTNNYVIQNSEQVDLLQEFFIPLQQFKPFVYFLQSLHPELSKPLMNITIRDLQADQESLLRYAPEERIAFVMFFRGPKTVAFERELRTTVLKITDRALALGGSYYLPYRAYQTKQQFSTAYPQQQQFNALIRRYNPQGVFMNQFYKNYLGDIPLPDH